MRINKKILFLAFVIISFCFISIFIFCLPSFVQIFDLSKNAKSNIGSAVGGITAPVIGIFSSILLYLALTRQTQSNINQRLKNESDIIFLLLNQLDSEVASFYSKYKQGKEEFKFYGLEGINEFTEEFRYNSDYNNADFTFKDLFESNQLLLIVRTYKLVEVRIKMSELSEDLKYLFQSKLNAFFDCKMKRPLQNICEKIELQHNMKDEVTDEIQEFIKFQI